MRSTKREIDPPITGEPETSWGLMPHVRGLGYASEALRAATAWGQQFFGSTRAVCLVDPENAPSLRIPPRDTASAKRTARYIRTV